MYGMKEVSSSFFCMMMSFHNQKIITLDKLTNYDLRPQSNPDNVFPTLGGNEPMPSFSNVDPGVFIYSTLIVTYDGSPPQVLVLVPSFMSIITSYDKPSNTPSPTIEASSYQSLEEP